MAKVKDYLYVHNGYYTLKFGISVSSGDFDWICGVWDLCDGVGWIPSRVLPILEGFRSSDKSIRVVRVYKYYEGKYILHLKGFYVFSGGLFEVRDIIREYYENNCDDTLIDRLFVKVKKKEGKKKGLPKHVNYIESTDKYRVSKHIGGKCVYYGQYDNLDDALRVRDCLIEKGWVIPKPRKAPYRTDKRYRYIQKTSVGHYNIVKQGQHFGTFRKLNEAMEERDWLVEHNWCYDDIDLY